MDKLLSYIIIEDSRVDELILRSIVDEYPFFRYIGTAVTAVEAIAFIKSTLPKVVFIDIDLPDGSGIETLRILKSIIPIAVFTTSYSEFAIEGFELSAMDYIVKPVTKDRLVQTISRIEDYWHMQQKAAAYEVLIEQETITIKEGYSKIQLLIADIQYLEAMQDYTKVVTLQRKYMVNIPLSGFLLKFSNEKFIRLHRSYAVPKSAIKSIKANEAICNNIVLPIGKTYRTTLSNIKL